jgi:Protein of unknown function (DUF4232)
MTMTATPHTSRWRWFLGLLAVSGIVLASCSSGTPSASRTHKHGKTTTTTTTSTTAPSATSSTVAGAAAPPCGISSLKGTQAAGGAAAGGAATLVIVLSNSSKAPCSLTGYPGIQLLAANGSDISTTLQQGGSGIPSTYSPAPVNLAADGGQASFLLYWVALPSKSEPTCTLAPKMQVSVPGSAKAFTMTAEIGACGGIVQASPFQPGVVAP